MWRYLVTLCLGLAWVGLSWAQQPTPGLFIVHEWGTFLSVQGSDGITLGGMVESEEGLPGFVLERGPRGWERMMTRRTNVFSKMETPVTYFYTDRERYVSFEASMPKGLLTHWYPTVSYMTPEFKKGESLKLDVGSTINFGRFHIRPATRQTVLSQLPAVGPNDPWLAMRQTDSAIVSSATGLKAPKHREEEKFLFYRGLGTFQLPLVVKSEGKQQQLTLNLQNTGGTKLTGAFLIEVSEDAKQIRWAPLGDLASNGQSFFKPHYQLPAPSPILESIPIVKQQVAQSLVATGLYPKEAAAMVDHWEKSYFQTPGMRVLYVLPRELTDQHIPIKVEPKPQEVVRTMVGRVELITPDLEYRVIRCLNDLHHGSDAEKQQAEQFLASYGRFRQALLRRALHLNLSAELKNKVQELLTVATTTLVLHEEPLKELSIQQFLTDAVVNGLKADNVSNDVVQKLLSKEENFVQKCTLCFLVRKAFSFYRGTVTPTGPTKLNQATVDRLMSDDQAVRFAAMRELTDRYTKEAWKVVKLTPEAKKRLETELQQARKEASTLMRAGQKSCPLCDGACNIPDESCCTPKK